MTLIGRVLLLLSFCLAWGSGRGDAKPAQSSRENTVAVHFEDRVNPAGKAGAHRSGVFCAPSGSWHWGDFARPSVDATEHSISELAASVIGDTGLTIQIVVTRARLNLCTPYIAGGRNGFKYDGEVEVQIDLSTAGQSRRTMRFIEKFRGKGKDPRIDPSVIGDAELTVVTKGLAVMVKRD